MPAPRESGGHGAGGVGGAGGATTALGAGEGAQGAPGSYICGGVPEPRVPHGPHRAPMAAEGKAGGGSLAGGGRSWSSGALAGEAAPDAAGALGTLPSRGAEGEDRPREPPGKGRGGGGEHRPLGAVPARRGGLGGIKAGAAAAGPGEPGRMSAAPGTSRAPQPLLRFPEGAGGPGGGRAAGEAHAPGPCPCPGGPRKRRRTTFSRGQLSELERAFAAVPYPDIATREHLAELTQLPEAKIQVSAAGTPPPSRGRNPPLLHRAAPSGRRRCLTVCSPSPAQVWFQNRRARRIRSAKLEPPPLPPPPGERGPPTAPPDTAPGPAPKMPSPGARSPARGLPTSLGSISDLIYSAAITNLGEP